MFQWITVLETLGYILIFPGFLFCFLVGLFLSGVDRKIVARMQKRVGPPLLQPFYDFFKLCGKETIVPAAANKGPAADPGPGHDRRRRGLRLALRGRRPEP